ncbi:MAG: iron-sulfur cluster assembly accessory protein [Chloroflexi bacterium]|nr:iron-sulfur cluster assembly accessory protein [Chloroflexota bacterium]
MSDTEQTLGAGKIVIVTDAAREKIREIMEMQNISGRGAIRVGINGRGPAGFAYSMALEEDAVPEPGEAVQDEGDFKVLVDGPSIAKLTGASIDFVGQLVGGGFKIDNPNSVWDDPLAAEIQAILDSQINPGVASHGGFVELLDVQENRVFVKMGGGCQGCGMASVTLKQGVEVMLREKFPQIVEVVDSTDHAGGSNPYYQPAKGAGGHGGHGAQSPFHAPAKG